MIARFEPLIQFNAGIIAGIDGAMLQVHLMPKQYHESYGCMADGLMDR